MYVKKDLQNEYRQYRALNCIKDTREVKPGESVRVYMVISSGSPNSIRSTFIGIRERVVTVARITPVYVVDTEGERYHIKSRNRPVKILKE